MHTAGDEQNFRRRPCQSARRGLPGARDRRRADRSAHRQVGDRPARRRARAERRGGSAWAGAPARSAAQTRAERASHCGRGALWALLRRVSETSQASGVLQAAAAAASACAVESTTGARIGPLTAGADVLAGAGASGAVDRGFVAETMFSCRSRTSARLAGAAFAGGRIGLGLTGQRRSSGFERTSAKASRPRRRSGRSSLTTAPRRPRRCHLDRHEPT